MICFSFFFLSFFFLRSFFFCSSCSAHESTLAREQPSRQCPSLLVRSLYPSLSAPPIRTRRLRPSQPTSFALLAEPCFHFPAHPPPAPAPAPAPLLSSVPTRPPSRTERRLQVSVWCACLRVGGCVLAGVRQFSPFHPSLLACDKGQHRTGRPQTVGEVPWEGVVDGADAG